MLSKKKICALAAEKLVEVKKHLEMFDVYVDQKNLEGVIEENLSIQDGHLKLKNYLMAIAIKTSLNNGKI